MCMYLYIRAFNVALFHTPQRHITLVALSTLPLCLRRFGFLSVLSFALMRTTSLLCCEYRSNDLSSRIWSYINSKIIIIIFLKYSDILKLLHGLLETIIIY